MKKIFAPAIVLAAALLFSACGSKLNPTQTVTAVFEAVRLQNRGIAALHIDYDSLMDYSEGDNISNNDETTKFLVEKLRVKVISEEIKDGRATVKTEITNLDMQPVFSDYVDEAVRLIFEDALSSRNRTDNEKSVSDKLQTALIDLIKKQERTTTKTVDIIMEKQKDGWFIKLDHTLQDAVFGGLSGSIREMVRQGRQAERQPAESNSEIKT